MVTKLILKFWTVILDIFIILKFIQGRLFGLFWTNTKMYQKGFTFVQAARWADASKELL